jgi:hypothetical protein
MQERETARETDATNRRDRRGWGAKQSKAKHECTHARTTDFDFSFVLAFFFSSLIQKAD